MSTPARDLLGGPLSAVEQRLLAAYEGLKSLRKEALPPCAAANVDEALAALWQVVHGLALVSDRPDL